MTLKHSLWISLALKSTLRNKILKIMTIEVLLSVTKNDTNTLFYVLCSLLFFPHVLTAHHPVRFSSSAVLSHRNRDIERKHKRIFSRPQRIHTYRTSIHFFSSLKSIHISNEPAQPSELYSSKLCASSSQIFIFYTAYCIFYPQSSDLELLKNLP